MKSKELLQSYQLSKTEQKYFADLAKKRASIDSRMEQLSKEERAISKRLQTSIMSVQKRRELEEEQRRLSTEIEHLKAESRKTIEDRKLYSDTYQKKLVTADQKKAELEAAEDACRQAERAIREARDFDSKYNAEKSKYAAEAAREAAHEAYQAALADTHIIDNPVFELASAAHAELIKETREGVRSMLSEIVAYINEAIREDGDIKILRDGKDPVGYAALFPASVACDWMDTDELSRMRTSIERLIHG